MLHQHWVILELKQNQDQIAKWDPFLLHGYITFKAKQQDNGEIGYFRVDWTSGGLRTPFRLKTDESFLETFIQGNERRAKTGAVGVAAGAAATVAARRAALQAAADVTALKDAVA